MQSHLSGAQSCPIALWSGEIARPEIAHEMVREVHVEGFSPSRDVHVASVTFVVWTSATRRSLTKVPMTTTPIRLSGCQTCRSQIVTTVLRDLLSDAALGFVGSTRCCGTHLSSSASTRLPIRSLSSNPSRRRRRDQVLV